MVIASPTGPPPEFMMSVVLADRLDAVSGGDRTNASLVLVPSWTPLLREWNDLDALTTVLNPGGVRRIGAELSGLDPAGVRLTGTTPVSSAMERLICAETVHVNRALLSSDEVMASPLVRSETFRRLATTLLLTFPNTALARLHDPNAPEDETAEPATVRRATEFMDANAQSDIDITQIAEAARVGARGLQAAFRRHRNQTPLEYLRQVRMDGAHRDLQAGDPTRGDTVATIAARWGFTHAGRFSVEYREIHGCSPREALRR
jgi:AraC-like DNA-binding protein